MAISHALRLTWLLAAQEAVSAQEACIEPEHFLLAVLRLEGVGDPNWRVALRQAKFDVASIEGELRLLMEVVAGGLGKPIDYLRALEQGVGQGKHQHGEGPVPRSERLKVPRSERLKAAFEAAESVVRKDDGTRVRVWHVLAQIFSDAKCLACRLAVQRGCDVVRLAARLGTVDNDWWQLRCGQVLVTGAWPEVLSYVEMHCGLPAMPPVTLFNCGSTNSPATALEFTLNLVPTCNFQLDIPSLGPFGRCQIDVPNSALLNHLQHLRAGESKTLSISAPTHATPAVHAQVRALGPWQWPFRKAARKTLAAYVSPHHPVVEAFVAEMQIVSKCPLSKLACQDNGVPKVLTILYSALGNRKVWMPPNAQTDNQSIRPPNHMFANGVAGGIPYCCIDLALFVAACLRNIGLCPVIVLVGQDDIRPGAGHAVAGCWAGSIPGGRPVDYNPKRIGSALDKHALYLVEWTRPNGNPIPTLKEAGDAAKEAGDAAGCLVQTSQWVCMIDIAACCGIPPIPDPLDGPLSEVVQKAYAEAMSFAQGRGAQYVEAVDLLWGVFAAAGDNVKELCAEAEIENDDLLTQMKQIVSRLGVQKETPLKLSDTARAIQWKARELTEGGTVDELHLLQALVDFQPNSATLKDVWSKLKLKSEAVQQFLNTQPKFQARCNSMPPVQVLSAAQGLLPRKRGPKLARKCSAEVVELVFERRIQEPPVTWDLLAAEVERRLGVRLHPRTLQRALAMRIQGALRKSAKPVPGRKNRPTPRNGTRISEGQ